MRGRKPTRDWAAVLKDAKKRGLSQAAVSAAQGVSNTAVCKLCKRHGIVLPREPSHRARADWPAVLLAAKANGLCQADVARAQGVSCVSVHKHCKKLGIDLPHGNTGQRAACDWLAELHDAQASGATASDLAHRLGVTRQAVNRQEHLLGVRLSPERNAERAA